MKLNIYNPIDFKNLLEVNISEIDIMILVDSQKALLNQLNDSDFGRIQKKTVQNYLFRTLVEFEMQFANHSNSEIKSVLHDLSLSRQNFIYQKIYQKGDPYEQLFNNHK
jgi:hypothetical protein